ncbi:hypothetical protein [Streptomyces katrae]|nr:hypothetical protein [Streptomyces katrae]
MALNAPADVVVDVVGQHGKDGKAAHSLTGPSVCTGRLRTARGVR